MADLGALTKLVNSDELTLQIGSNPDIYIMLTDLVLHIGRTENRVATTDAGALYSYGKGENFFTCTLQYTNDQIDASYTNTTTAAGINTLTQITTDGDMEPIAWKIVANDLGGATKTFACTGILKEYDLKKGTDGKYVEIDIFVRITGDTVSIS